MRTIAAPDAVAAVAAQRYGYDEVVRAMLFDTGNVADAAELADALGELSSVVSGVLVALTGHGDPTSCREELPEPGSVDELADLLVRCAAEGDHGGVMVVCAEAAACDCLQALLVHLVSDANRALDSLDQLPGPGGDAMLARLGLAAAR